MKSRRTDPAEVVAQLRMALEKEGVPMEDVLKGAVILGEMGYPALARDYAARVLRDSRDDEMRATARALIVSARLERGLA